MNETHINNIVKLFHEAKVWNDGVFAGLVDKYTKEHNLDNSLVHNKLAQAFENYLATNIKSEAAIRYRLKELIK